MEKQTWTPEYSRWRHGGWYVNNVQYPSGAVGCVSNNYPDKRWRIVCADLDDITFDSRDAAARAEAVYAEALRRGRDGRTLYVVQTRWDAGGPARGDTRGDWSDHFGAVFDGLSCEAAHREAVRLNEQHRNGAGFISAAVLTVKVTDESEVLP